MKKQKSKDPIYKVVSLGERRVGKTSIITRFFYNTFSEKSEETVCGYCKQKTIQTKNGPIDLAVWDTAGQERFHSMPPIYFKNSDAAIIVYDITVKGTLQKVRQWIQELKQFSQNDNVLPVLVGNKDDMHIQRDVEQSCIMCQLQILIEVDELCNEYQVKHFLVSAKSGKGITEIFQYIADGKLTNDNLELIQSAKQTNERGYFWQGNKKQAQNDGGGYC